MKVRAYFAILLLLLFVSCKKDEVPDDKNYGPIMLLSPGDGLVMLDSSITLRWTDSGYEKYSISMGHDKDLNKLGETADTTYLISELQRNSEYKWIITGFKEDGGTLVSDTGKFYISINQYDKIVFLNPRPADSTDRVENPVSFGLDVYGDVENEASYIFYYKVAIAQHFWDNYVASEPHVTGDVRQSNSEIHWMMEIDMGEKRLYSPVYHFWSYDIEGYPKPPELLSPLNGQVLDEKRVLLSWTAEHENPEMTDDLKFNLFFGTDEDPEQIAWGIEEKSYFIDGLKSDTVYYWRVESMDYKHTTSSSLWHFRTGANMKPYPAKIIDPPGQVIPWTNNIELKWDGTDPENDNLAYDVYFGDQLPPPLINEEYNDISIGLEIQPLTWYYARIDTRDPKGNLAVGYARCFVSPPEKKLKQLTCYQADTVLNVKTYTYDESGFLSEFEKQEWMKIGPVMVYHWRERKQFTWENERPATEERQWYYWSSYNIRWSLREASMVYNYDSTGMLGGIAFSDNTEVSKFRMEYDEYGRIITRVEPFHEWDKESAPTYSYQYTDEDKILVSKSRSVSDGSVIAIDQDITFDTGPNPEWVEQYPVYLINNVLSNQYQNRNVNSGYTFREKYYEYQYEYDADGYPLVRYQVLPDSSLRWVYEYY